MNTQTALQSAVCLGLLLAVTAAFAGVTVHSEPEQRQSIELTVYTQDLALVRDVRQMPLPRGEFALEFRGVPTRIQPATLLVETGPGMAVLEQNYEFDLMSRDRILEKYVGHEVSWILEDGGRLTGRLLGMAAGPVFEINGEIMFEVPGRIVLPRLPENLRAQPTLVWRVQRDKAADTELDVSYLTSGLSWNADYVLQLNPEGNEADLRGWVTVENRSGAAYDEATLQLVAGDINRVRPAMLRHEMLAMGAPKRAQDSATMVEETLYDYHLYTVPWATSLPDNSNKQVSLLSASGLTVDRHYTVRGASHYFRGGQSQDKQDVWVSYTFQNRETNQLGMPLPAGVVRVYGQSSDGRRQLLGEDRITHTPKDEEIELRVGKAFDIAAERVRKDYKRVSDRVHRTTWHVVLRNHKTEDVVVEVREAVGGDWSIMDSNQEYEKVSAQEILFRVPVPADGKSTVKYTVEVRY